MNSLVEEIRHESIGENPSDDEDFSRLGLMLRQVSPHSDSHQAEIEQIANSIITDSLPDKEIQKGMRIDD